MSSAGHQGKEDAQGQRPSSSVPKAEPESLPDEAGSNQAHVPDEQLDRELEEALAALDADSIPGEGGLNPGDTLVANIDFQHARHESLGDAAAFMPSSAAEESGGASRNGSSQELKPLDPAEALRLFEEFQENKPGDGEESSPSARDASEPAAEDSATTSPTASEEAVPSPDNAEDNAENEPGGGLDGLDDFDPSLLEQLEASLKQQFGATTEPSSTEAPPSPRQSAVDVPQEERPDVPPQEPPSPSQGSGPEATVAADEPEIDEKLGKLLEAEGIVLAEEVASLEQDAATRPLAETLAGAGPISRRQLWAAMAASYQIPQVDLAEIEPSAEAIQAVPRDMAASLTALPLALTETVGVVVLAEPSASGKALRQLRIQLGGRKVKAVQAPAEAIREAINRYYGGGGEEAPAKRKETTSRVVPQRPKRPAMRQSMVFSRGQAVPSSLASAQEAERDKQAQPPQQEEASTPSGAEQATSQGSTPGAPARKPPPKPSRPDAPPGGGANPIGSPVAPGGIPAAPPRLDKPLAPAPKPLTKQQQARENEVQERLDDDEDPIEVFSPDQEVSDDLQPGDTAAFLSVEQLQEYEKREHQATSEHLFQDPKGKAEPDKPQEGKDQEEEFDDF